MNAHAPRWSVIAPVRLRCGLSSSRGWAACFGTESTQGHKERLEHETAGFLCVLCFLFELCVNQTRKPLLSSLEA